MVVPTMHVLHLVAALWSLAAPLQAAILPSAPTFNIRTSDPSSSGSSSSLTSTSDPSNLPLLIWHGLGDSFDSDGIASVADLYADLYPSSDTISISLAHDDGAADRQASFLGNLTTQIAYVCGDLLSRPQVRDAPALNALGFSQGGQFLRALIERCDGLPTVHSLVTFGSQHNGIFEFAECDGGDWWCRAWSGALRDNTWAGFVQSRVVPAQYFRDPEDLESYLEGSNFLADINNEREAKNARYRKNFSRTGRFVMIMFADDTVVKPKESAWFAEVNRTSGEVVPLEERPIYKEDWIGLKAIGERGRLEKVEVPGGHMQIGDKELKKAMLKYLKPPKKTATIGAAGAVWRSIDAWAAWLRAPVGAPRDGDL